jgi:hypothetical protein
LFGLAACTISGLPFGIAEGTVTGWLAASRHGAFSVT